MPSATSTEAATLTAVVTPAQDAASRAPAGSPGSMPDARHARGVGLAWRISAATAFVVVAVMLATLAVASVIARRAADEAVARGLEQTAERVRDKLIEQRASLHRAAQIFVDNPSFAATMGAAATSGDSATLFDQDTVAAQSLNADFTQITNAEGIRLAKSDDPHAAPVDLSASPLIRGALEGRATEGFGVLDSTNLFHAVAVPVRGAVGAQAGALMAAKFVTDSVAGAIGSETGSALVFYTVVGGHPIISISPKSLGARTDVRDQLEGSVMSGGDKGRMDSEGMMMSMGERREVMLAGRHYVGNRIALLSAGQTEVGGFIALRDKDRELAGYYSLRNALLLTAAAGLLLGILLSIGTARRIVRPVRALADAAQRASEGDYAADIPVASRDEIGTLARAFRGLLSDLREKQSLVDFLQTPSGRQTVAVERVTPTMQREAMHGGAVLEAGQTLAVRYEITALLGVGGMGMVYKAIDRELGEAVAIKTLRPDLLAQDSTALERFKGEIRLARRISHRNVVRTHDLGEAGGLYFITMEFVEGRSLKDIITSRGALPVAVVLPIAKQLCRALQVAHEEGVIHRDIKPQNMVVGPDGVLKVMDFGIARLVARTTGQTQAGMVIGTPEYMAPEQLLGDDVDARADLYAAGVVLYECLVGHLPHQADSLITLISKVLEETPPAPRQLQPDVPSALSDLVMRAMSRERDDRPATAAEMHSALERIG